MGENEGKKGVMRMTFMGKLERMKENVLILRLFLIVNIMFVLCGKIVGNNILKYT